MDDFHFPVRIKLKDATTLYERFYHSYALGDEQLPRKWRDSGDGPCEPTQWCIDNIGLKGYQWKRLHNGTMLFYYFKREDDATWFKLTWGDY